MRRPSSPRSRENCKTAGGMERYGKPVAFYSDKHAIFRVNSKEAQGDDGMTQFGRSRYYTKSQFG
jgi:hypothetical protein